MQATLHSYLRHICLAVICSVALVPTVVIGQETEKKQTVEPVFRVPKIKRANQVKDDSAADRNTEPATVTRPKLADVVNPQPIASNNFPTAPVERVADARAAKPATDKKATSLVPKFEAATDNTNAHPLDRAIEIAKTGLQNMQANIQDYSAILVKRERVGNKLTEPIYMKIKIRNPRTTEDRSVPFSVYMKFMKPRSVVGREVIWVQGQNNDNLIVHDTNPIVRFKNLYLDPTGFMAMKGNKYPIYDAGLENLVIKLIEKAERDRAAGLCEVRYLEGAQINKRPCTLIEVQHNKRCAPYEFHIAKVYVDDDYNIPVRFVAYDWPAPGGKPQIIEEYTYINVKLNIGLDDNDFNIANTAYNFVK